MAATYFRTAQDFHAWLERHHDSAAELLVGFFKRAAGREGITYREALDEALAFGWIDGVRRGVDDARYTIRFTPRKAKSIWSAVNIARVGELTAAGRMREPGLAAFARRDEERSRVYAYERAPIELDGKTRRLLARDKKAWAFYEAQAPWYRRTAAHWIMSAKRPETRERRIAHLLDCSRRELRIDPLRPNEKPPRKTARKKPSTARRNRRTSPRRGE